MSASTLRRLLWVVLSLFLTACNSDGGASVPACTPASGAQAQVAAQAMHVQAVSHIPAAVQSFSDRGAIAPEQQLPVTIALNLNNEDELDQRLGDLYQPGNPGYHKFVTPDEFHARYSPTPAQVGDAVAFLKQNGMTDVVASPNGMLIHATGTAQGLGEAFHTEIHEYEDAQGNTYFAPATEPEMPQGLSIRAVHGLQNVTRLRSFAHPRPASSTSPLMGTGPEGGMSPADLRSAYSIPSNVNGSGQTLALVELDAYSASDITSYEHEFGLPGVSLQNVLIDGASGTPGSGQGEVTLDIELMIAMASGASRIMVYEAPNNSQALLDLYSRIADDDQAAQISTSWGGPENEQSTAFLETENAVFKQMALQGQSIYAASGDAGAYDNGQTLSVDDPASQPFVVAVGGTQLASSGGSYQGETTWNNGSPSNGAGGGGVSTVWTQPSWQSGVASARNMASSSMRNVPDVSLNSDPETGYAIYVGGQWTVYGGTSCAAPLWAGFTALVNQQRVSSGLATLGFTDPYLYSVGQGSRYGSDFHDISNDSTNLYYPALPGYDDATGWGTLNGEGLFQDLSTDPEAPASDLSC